MPPLRVACRTRTPNCSCVPCTRCSCAPTFQLRGRYLRGAQSTVQEAEARASQTFERLHEACARRQSHAAHSTQPSHPEGDPNNHPTLTDLQLALRPSTEHTYSHLTGTGALLQSAQTCVLYYTLPTIWTRAITKDGWLLRDSATLVVFGCERTLGGMRRVHRA
jgi:hypothetical protein